MHTEYLLILHANNKRSTKNAFTYIFIKINENDFVFRIKSLLCLLNCKLTKKAVELYSHRESKY